MVHSLPAWIGIALLACVGPVAGAERANPGAAALHNPQPALPLSEVVLYSSGVGYFQRDGKIEGHGQVELRFKTDNINDLLKSLVIQDFDGGHVSTVTYGSRDPMAKTLKSFGIDLTSNPSLGQLLDQVRGERVEVDAPKPITGTILGVEKKQQPAGENRTISEVVYVTRQTEEGMRTVPETRQRLVGGDKGIEVEYLNLLTDNGLQSLPMSQVRGIKLLNEQINTELRQALEVLATGHDTQKKTVAIQFDGKGQRKVSVAYIAETPIWKTSYRLVMDEKQKPFLQGWAIVENTTDDDWKDVRLALISGRPISFTMDLYQPLYVARPVVLPELYASLRPQTYGQAMEEASKPAATASPLPAGAPEAEVRRSLMFRDKRMERKLSGVAGVASPTSENESLVLQRGVSSAAQALQAGELFQYAIKTPVSLARQKSAMLPIVSQDVEGQKVSIYNAAVQPKYPLNGFRLKNTSALHLMQGPITVFDGGSYAGDARIEDLAPGQERLLSYAMDLTTEVEPVGPNVQQDLVTVRLSKGTLIATRKASEERTYNVRNRDRKKKLVLIEHPFRADWKLVEPSEPSERTREVYRFAVPVQADQLAKLQVHEERQYDETVQITSLGPDVIAYYLRAPEVSTKVKEALQQVVQLRDRQSQTAAERARREARVAEIGQEQSRIRENMTRLAQNSELYTRYVKKLDEQETELESLRKEIEKLKTTEAQQQKELNDYLMGLELG